MWTPASLYMHAPGVTVDVGQVRINGKPMFGAADAIGWGRWWDVGPTAGWYGGADGVRNSIGGLTARPLGAPAFFATLAGNVTWPTQTADFAANSPAIMPAVGCKYENLVFQTSGASGNGDLRIQIRDATTGALVPDAEVPHNSVGLGPYASIRQTVHVGQLANPQKIVSLSGLTTGRRIYIDVWGHAAQSDYRSQPRLSGVWVSIIPGGTSTVVKTGKKWKKLKIQ
jgi:hypothetical protein